MNGAFPNYIIERFTDLLDYFGPSPIVVRSSSLLEDSFESTFAGVSKSIFCINQGSSDERLRDFISAVQTVYASTMSEEALKYRSARGLLDRDEQMAVLVQRVSGVLQGRFFFPHVAGVGLSFNPYVWSEEIDPTAGVMRLVFGLGTRAVSASDGDYTRMVALGAPEKQIEGAFQSKGKEVQGSKIRGFPSKSVSILSTHFFSELVERDMLYFALFPSRENDFLNTDLLENARNKLPELLPGEAKWANVVRVLDPGEWEDGKVVRLNASAIKQKVICYRKTETPR